jgi:hypothetical protein
MSLSPPRRRGSSVFRTWIPASATTETPVLSASVILNAAKNLPQGCVERGTLTPWFSHLVLSAREVPPRLASPSPACGRGGWGVGARAAPIV